jgi:hypothetical protein
VIEEMSSCQRLYFRKKLLRGGEDESIEGRVIALERPSSSFGEWSHWSVGGM